MENKEDEKIDELLTQMMLGSKLESPSLGFSLSVMREIESIAAQSKKSTPLISRKVWITLSVAYAALMAALISTIDFKSSNWLNSIDWNRFTSVFSFSKLSSLHIQQTVFYGLAAISILFLIQILFLKKFADKSIALDI